MSPRKIVFVESAARIGGVEFSTLYLAQRLDRSRWTPLVICPEEGDLSRSCHQSGVQALILPQPRFRSTSLRLGVDRRLPNPPAWIFDIGIGLIVLRRLIRVLRQERPALVVTKGLFAHFYGGMAARCCGIPCVWHLQDFISERFGGLYRRFIGQAAAWLPAYIVADGNPIAKQLPSSLGEKISVVYNGVDTEVFRPGIDGSKVRRELGIPRDAMVIGNVARMTPWKGQHHLLEAFARIVPEFPRAYLLLVGSPVFDTDNYEIRLRQRTATLDLTDRVIFAGYRYDLPQVLSAMDIFAYTSVEKDTSPLSLLSAMATGLPVVAFDIEGIREVINDDKSGLLISVKDIESLAKALNCLIVDAALRQQLADNARYKAKTAFSLDRYVSQMEEIFMKC